MVFRWSVSDCKSLQVSGTLLRNLADLNNAVVWIVSTHPFIYKSSVQVINRFVNVLRAPITIGIIINFIFHSFFTSLARSRYLSFFSHSFSFILWSAGTAKSTILNNLDFFKIIILCVRLAGIRWDFCISKSLTSFCVSFSRVDAEWYIY